MGSELTIVTGFPVDFLALPPRQRQLWGRVFDNLDGMPIPQYPNAVRVPCECCGQMLHLGPRSQRHYQMARDATVVYCMVCVARIMDESTRIFPIPNEAE